MQLGDILRNTVLVTIAGKQLGSGVHCRIPGRREGSETPTSRVTYSGALYCRRDLEVPWNVLSAFCTRFMERAIRAISVMISPSRFDFLSRRVCAPSRALRSGCRFQFGDNSVPARIATSPKTDRIRKRTADTTRPFQTTRGFSVTRDPRDLSCMVLESTMSVHVA